MKRIYPENTKNFDRVLYSESYVVHYTYEKKGIWIRDSMRYFAASKNAHRSIEAVWKKKYPKARLITIIYE